MRNTSCSLLILSLSLFASALFAVETSEEFRRFDKNADNKVTRDEFPEALKNFFDRIDTNGDGAITPDEDAEFQKRRNARPNNGPPPALKIPDSVEAHLDVAYAGTDNPRQKLDVFVPKKLEEGQTLPLIVFIHGGGWQSGDKRGGVAMFASLVEQGHAVGASIGYRLSGEAVWPAQIHDCKAALRFLRGNAAKYHVNPNKIALVGTSAGGHLVSLLGTTADEKALEGDLGDYDQESTRVTCVVDFFGPTDFTVLKHAVDDGNSAVAKLFGGPGKTDEAREASPVVYVSANDPPFLLVHGTKDPLVPFSQSEILQGALERAGVSATLITVTDGGHGRFENPEVYRRVNQFFEKYLLDRDITLDTNPIPAGKP